MERSAIHLLANRGKSQRAIARELGISRVTVARVLAEPVDREPARRRRASQETLLRGLVACLLALGFVPWVLVFDNMKTVTSGRDASGQPVWTPALRRFAAEMGFHPQACDPGAGNQKGSVESLVKWIKGNFLPGRDVANDADLAGQTGGWIAMANARPSDATGVLPGERLSAERARGGVLPPTAQEGYGLLCSLTVTAESLIRLAGNSYSVPVAHVGMTVSVRLTRDALHIYHDTNEVACHRRVPDGAGRRVVEPEHVRPLFTKKPRAQVMLYRQALLALSTETASYISEVSYRRRERLRAEVLAAYALFVLHGWDALIEAMAQAEAQGIYGAEYLEVLLMTAGAQAQLPPPVPLDLPPQDAVDRALEQYEPFVTISTGGASW